MRTTVGELRELIKNLPDNMPIVVPSEDHSYRYAYASVNEVWFEDGGDHMSEYFPSVPLDKDDFIDNCLVIE
jgi:hypothetical protein